ncbi:MAG TPA: hypothetical protein VEL47_04055 [Myxococcota bacterium]|nr:hypothetical protein [Myxococcota bacterium]
MARRKARTTATALITIFVLIMLAVLLYCYTCRKAINQDLLNRLRDGDKSLYINYSYDGTRVSEPPEYSKEDKLHLDNLVNNHF